MKRAYTLPEIIFSILVVVFVGVFSVKMYMQAETMQNKARDLDMASFAAQTSVETFKAEYSHPVIVYYDSDFNVVSEIDEKGFVLTMVIADDGMGFFDVNVDVAKVVPYFGETENRVFSLTTAVYKGQPPKPPGNAGKPPTFPAKTGFLELARINGGS